MFMNSNSKEKIAVLFSGGVDSTALVAMLLDRGYRVQPIYVEMGCVWETAERQAVARLLAELADANLDSLIELSQPVADLYGNHWSTTGLETPDHTTSDDAVFLWGRNPLLLLKPMLWCQQHGIEQLALGTLSANPFADASEGFLARFSEAMQIGQDVPIRIVQPLAEMSKAQLMARAASLPLAETFSCLAPAQGLHCGRCNKCEERARALGCLPGGDPTRYVEAVCNV